MEHLRDVVVAGGGPAGCATALALALHGITDVLLLDAPALPARRIGESVPPDLWPLLSRLGVLQRFLQDAHEPCLGSCSSWGSDDLGFNDFLLNPYGQGWHLDRRRFDAMMLEQVAAAGIEVRSARHDLRSLPAARVTVDATGAGAGVARSRGARQRFVDRLYCIHAFFALPEGALLSRLTMLEAVDAGWWYAARVPNREVVVAFASDAETIRQRDATRLEPWRALLASTRHLGPALADCRLLEGTLGMSHAPSFLLDRTAGDGWLAVGDAASAYDPISAGGIYKALDDGLRAGDAIAAALDGDPAAIDEYQASVRTRFDQYLTNRRYFYNIEQRFPDAPFWQRRTFTDSDAPVRSL